MIYKSYLVEKNINSINENLVLFYGENIGIKNDFKGKIKKTNNNCEFIFFDQKNILQNYVENDVYYFSFCITKFSLFDPFL